MTDVKRKYLLFVLALVTVSALGLLVGPETAQAQAVPNNHQPCGQYNSFSHDEDDDVIDWGVMTLCPTDTYYIYMEGTLEWYSTALNQWLQFDFIEKTCNTYLCIGRDTFNSDYSGTYRIQHCFQAQSIQSSWPWSCVYRYHGID